MCLWPIHRLRRAGAQEGVVSPLPLSPPCPPSSRPHRFTQRPSPGPQTHQRLLFLSQRGSMSGQPRHCQAHFPSSVSCLGFQEGHMSQRDPARVSPDFGPQPVGLICRRLFLPLPLNDSYFPRVRSQSPPPPPPTPAQPSMVSRSLLIHSHGSFPKAGLCQKQTSSPGLAPGPQAPTAAVFWMSPPGWLPLESQTQLLPLLNLPVWPCP